MTFRVPLSVKYNLKVKIGAFGAETRNSNFQDEIIKLRRLPTDFWGSSIPDKTSRISGLTTQTSKLIKTPGAYMES